MFFPLQRPSQHHSYLFFLLTANISIAKYQTEKHSVTQVTGDKKAESNDSMFWFIYCESQVKNMILKTWGAAVRQCKSIR